LSRRKRSRRGRRRSRWYGRRYGRRQRNVSWGIGTRFRLEDELERNLFEVLFEEVTEILVGFDSSRRWVRWFGFLGWRMSSRQNRSRRLIYRDRFCWHLTVGAESLLDNDWRWRYLCLFCGRKRGERVGV
jgi:hypothetical protein